MKTLTAYVNHALAIAACLLLTLPGCVQRAGRLQYYELLSESEGRQLELGAYLPPAGSWNGREPLPLVVFLHGAGDDAGSADRRVVTAALDRAIRAGQLPPFIMVTPQGNFGFWTNWYDGSHRWKDWVLDEVVPRARNSFPIIPGRRGLHLLGISMGGGGGLMMWLKERDRFASASLISAPVLTEQEARDFLGWYMSDEAFNHVFGPPGSGHQLDPFRSLRSPADLHGSRLLFAAGTQDRGGILKTNRRFHRHLRRHRVPHEFLVFEGGHDWSAWARVFPWALCRQLPREGGAAPEASLARCVRR